MATVPDTLIAAEMSADEAKESSKLKVIGWLSVGVTVAAVGIFVGRELADRYKFNHRTPYDFYDHAGSRQTSEYGLGV
ncbi:MAG: hypothetical protein ABR906_02520 [Terracidiphilus sp.]|jgi:hypothetical protein